MTEDNNGGTRQTGRKDARREARIEAKRRKLAEQRAERAAAMAENDAAASGREKISPPMSAGNAAGTGDARPAGRQVTADAANREMRIRLDETEAASAGKVSRQEGTGAGAPSPGPDGGGNTPGPSRKRKKARIDLSKLTPKDALRILVALVVLIGLIYGALRMADYNDKKTDIMVTGEGFVHADRYDACVPIIGTDISEHQEGEIDWKKLKSSGMDYVFIRAGYRAADDGSLHADQNFDKNFKAARKSGMMVGVYFYSQALTPEEGKEEAEFVLDLLKPYKSTDVTMPVVIDYEIYKDGRLDKKIQAGELYAASFYHDIVLGFTNTIEKQGYETAVYASRDMLTNYMQADLIDDMANIWLARYDSDANLKADYWLWQCTDSAQAGGVEEAVDMSFWYMEPNKIYPTKGKRKKNAVSIGDCRVSFKRSAYEIRNFRADPKFDMTYDGKGMKEGRDYISSVVCNTRPGTGYVIVRGIGKYKDWIMYPFTIAE